MQLNQQLVTANVKYINSDVHYLGLWLHRSAHLKVTLHYMEFAQTWSTLNQQKIMRKEHFKIRTSQAIVETMDVSQI